MLDNVRTLFVVGPGFKLNERNKTVWDRNPLFGCPPPSFQSILSLAGAQSFTFHWLMQGTYVRWWLRNRSEHVRSNLCYLICLRHLIIPKNSHKSKKFYSAYFPPCLRNQLPSNISTTGACPFSLPFFGAVLLNELFCPSLCPSLTHIVFFWGV